MRLATRQSRVTAWVAVISVLVIGGILLSGCAPASQEPAGGPGSGVGARPAPSQGPAVPEGEAEPARAAEKPAGEEAEPASQAAAAELPPAPPVSTFAPAQDLVLQVQFYLEELEEAVATEGEYNDSVDKIVKHSNALILVALALGLHDTDNQFKAAAPAMVKAARQLAAAGDYAAAKEGVAALQAATASTEGSPSELKWEKLASLPALMEAVPLINTRLKRYIRDGRETKLKKAVDDLAGQTAALAVIAQGSMANSSETDLPNEVGKWLAFCVQMRDAATDVNARVRAFGQDGTSETFQAAKTAMKNLAQSCEDCHALFHPEGETTTEEEEEEETAE